MGLGLLGFWVGGSGVDWCVCYIACVVVLVGGFWCLELVFCGFWVLDGGVDFSGLVGLVFEWVGLFDLGLGFWGGFVDDFGVVWSFGVV